MGIPFAQLLPPPYIPGSTPTGSATPNPTPNPSAVPALPVIFHGALTVGGAPAAAGTRLYAKISKAGLPNVWKTLDTAASGRYNFPVAAAPGYDGGKVEFWMHGITGTVAAVYNANSQTSTVALNLAFPQIAATPAATPTPQPTRAPATPQSTPTPTPTPAPSATPQGDPGAVPAFPVIFHGDLTVGGKAAAAGTRLYAKISKAGMPPLQETLTTRASGKYDFPIAASGHDGGTVEFSMEGQTRKVTAAYRANSIAVELDLAF